MNNILAAAARAVLYGILGTGLVLIFIVGTLWPAYGPQGLWTVAWVGVAGVVAGGCGVAGEWLGKRRGRLTATLTATGNMDSSGQEPTCVPLPGFSALESAPVRRCLRLRIRRLPHQAPDFS